MSHFSKKWDIHQDNRQMARPRGFEPLTPRLEGGCSIQLSYGRELRSISILAFDDFCSTIICSLPKSILIRLLLNLSVEPEPTAVKRTNNASNKLTQAR